jgi:membrane associated rhomboid family serine protease/tetratricopeptide (TPR) repeat protein
MALGKQEKTVSPSSVATVSLLPECFLRGVPTVTIGLIAINVVAFLAMMLGGTSWLQPTKEQLLRWGANYGPLSLSDQPWRMLTSLFVHLSWIHLFVDTLFLYPLGRTAERIYGKNTFLLLYLSCGLAGGLFGLWFRPELITTGASGAIFGIAGCLAPVSWPTKHVPDDQVLKATWRLIYAGLIVLNLSIYGGHATASMTALGGMVAGVILGFALRPKLNSGTDQPRALVFLVALVVLFGGTQLVRHATVYLVRRERGISAYTEGDYDSAVRELESAVRERPADAYAQAVLGEAYLHSYEYYEAEAPLKQAIAISPQYSYASQALAYDQLVKQGLASYDSGDYDAAIPDLRSATGTRPNDAYAQFLLGSSYLQRDNYDQAEAPLKQALTLSPRYADAEEALAYIHAVTDRNEDALKEYADVVQQDPDNESARLGMGTALENLQRYEEAITVFNEAVHRRPDSADACYSLGAAYADAERYTEAVASLREALRLQPNYPEARKELAALCAQRKTRCNRP